MATNLSGIDLSGADLRAAWLKNADLHGADLRGANLSGANLLDADLSEADLRGSNLRDAILRRANLSRAYLHGADLRGADIEDTRLDGVRWIGDDDLRADPKPSDSIMPPGEESPEKPSPGPLEGEISPDEVSFTAIYPKEGKVETWHTLLVYTHLLSAVDDVRHDAKRYKDQIQAPKEVTSASSTPIPRGTDITIIPSCDGVVFNPKDITVKWTEDYHRADFRFRADESLTNDAARGEINIYVGPIIVGSLKFATLFNETDAQSDWEERARMYHQEDIFVSYSHKDSKVVLACKSAYDARGFNVLMDVDTLRSGQVWNEELMRMIDSATIFQLFWSQNSGQSKYCRQEWEHALKRKKEGFIRPVYWELPMPDPPKELRQYHFKFLKL